MAYIDVSGLAGISLLAGIDPVTREMFLSLATVDASINPIDIYKEMRICRRLDEDLRGFEVFLAAFGNVAKGGGKFTERYVQQLLGTRFIPYDADQELTVTGTVITDDGQEGVECFDRTGLTSTTVVDINYIPPQVEIIEVATGGGPTEAEIWAHIIEGSMTAEQMLRIILSSGALKVSGMDNQNPAFRSLADDKNRIVATTDEYGNRSAVTLDGS